MQELWTRIGKQAYFEIIHQLIISNLCIAPDKSSTSAASVLLVGSSEELGVPITVHQVCISYCILYNPKIRYLESLSTSVFYVLKILINCNRQFFL